VYDRVFNDKVLSFGVSGMLWNSNVLLFDHQSESLWSQVRGGAVTGPKSGTRLRAYPSTVTSWKKWRRKHPDTLVLSTDTGHRRDYSRDPYQPYYEERGAGLWRLFAPAPGEEEKRIVAAVELGGEKRAYPVELIRAKGELIDELGGQKFTLTIDPQTDLLSGETDSGETFAPVVLFWFVWKAANPDTTVFGEESH
jgi:hypothetical protein